MEQVRAVQAKRAEAAQLRPVQADGRARLVPGRSWPELALALRPAELLLAELVLARAEQRQVQQAARRLLALLRQLMQAPAGLLPKLRPRSAKHLKFGLERARTKLAVRRHQLVAGYSAGDRLFLRVQLERRRAEVEQPREDSLQRQRERSEPLF